MWTKGKVDPTINKLTTNVTALSGCQYLLHQFWRSIHTNVKIIYFYATDFKLGLKGLKRSFDKCTSSGFIKNQFSVT